MSGVGWVGETVTPGLLFALLPLVFQSALILLYGLLSIQPNPEWRKIMAPLFSISCSFVFTQAVCLSEACVEAARPCVKCELEGGQQISFACSVTATEVLRDFIQPKDQHCRWCSALVLNERLHRFCCLDQRNQTQLDEAEAPQQFL